MLASGAFSFAIGAGYRAGVSKRYSFIYLRARAWLFTGLSTELSTDPPRGVGLTPPIRRAARRRREALTRLTALPHERHPPPSPLLGGRNSHVASEEVGAKA